jgi:sporulation integral membrane protein YlbJ
MMKKVAIIPIILALAVMMLIYPQNCLDSARYGLELWLTAVLPSLLPFMAASFLLLDTGLVRLISAFFAPITRRLFYAPGEAAYVLIAASVSGYPVGARLTAELYARGELSEPDAQRIVRFTSVTGPVFLTGAVGAGLLGLPAAGAYLAASHYLSAVLVGILLGLLDRRRHPAPLTQRLMLKDAWARFKSDAASCPPIGAMLSSSVEKSLWALIKIGGFIILFAVLLELLSVTGVMDALVWLYTPFANLVGLDSAAAQAALAGSVEMTTGCARVAALSANMTAKLVLSSGIVAFGGLGIHMQTRAVCTPSGLMLRRFGMAKTLQCALASGLTALLLSIFPLSQTVAVFSPDTKTAAYSGVIFAVIVLAVLALIKLWQRVNPYPSSAYSRAPADSFGGALSNQRDSSQAPPIYRRRIPSRRS